MSAEHLSDSNRGEPEHRFPELKGDVVIQSVEERIGADGAGETIYKVSATHHEDAEALVDHLVEGHGAERVKPDTLSTSMEGGKTTFGFSGSWSAPWSPEGPKRNWGYVPPDSKIREN